LPTLHRSARRNHEAAAKSENPAALAVMGGWIEMNNIAENQPEEGKRHNFACEDLV